MLFRSISEHEGEMGCEKEGDRKEVAARQVIETHSTQEKLPHTCPGPTAVLTSETKNAVLRAASVAARGAAHRPVKTQSAFRGLAGSRPGASRDIPAEVVYRRSVCEPGNHCLLQDPR